MRAAAGLRTFTLTCGALPSIGAAGRAAGRLVRNLAGFAYRYDGGARIGAPAAPFALEGSLKNGSELSIPKIGRPTGIDLHTIDVKSPEERRWLLALCFPELRDEQRRPAMALDVIAATQITMLQGDGVARLREAFEATPDPVCVFHSACLFYWPHEACDGLENFLMRKAASAVSGA